MLDLAARVASLQEQLATREGEVEDVLQAGRDQVSCAEANLALQAEAAAAAETRAAALEQAAKEEAARHNNSGRLAWLPRRLLFLVAWSLIQHVVPLIWNQPMSWELA